MSRETDDPELLTDKASPEVEEDLEDLALGEDYALNPEYVQMIADALERGDSERLRDLLGALHAADIADLMGFLSSSDREELAPHLDPEILGEVRQELFPVLAREESHQVGDVFRAQGREQVAQAL